MNFDNQGIVSGTLLGHSILLRLTIRCTIINHSPSKILKLYENNCLRGSWSLDFVGKVYKMFELDGHTFYRRWIFLIKEDDNNYSISTTIFGYNPKTSTLQENYSSISLINLWLYHLITFEAVQFLLPFCAVIIFTNFFFKNILSSLLC